MVHNDLRMKLVSRAAVYHVIHQQWRKRRRIGRALYLVSVIMVFSTTLVLEAYFKISPPEYRLSDSAYALVGQSRDDTAKYLTHDETEGLYTFKVPKAEEQGATQHTGRVADAYTATLPENSRDGITLTDTTSNIGVTLIPQFKTVTGQKVDGDHLVYPFGAQKLVYTLKYNGLKEDIIVPEYIKDELAYKFTLQLPTGVEARLDDAGNIGIYSADTTLFGNISFGSDEDRERVDKARENSEKTTLLMTIPAPLVKDASGQEHFDRARFDLSNKSTAEAEEVNPDLPPEVPKSLVTKNQYTLTITASQLKDLSYPISVDPTMIVASASDFGKVNPYQGSEMDATNSLIQRSGLTGGSISSWVGSGVTNLPAGRSHGGAAIYNNYIYYISGQDSTFNTSTTVWYNTINPTTGTLGSWTATTSAPQALGSPEALAYNGYVYIFGGHDGDSAISTVRFSKIQSNGSLGSWQTTNNMPHAGFLYHAVAHNGHVYLSWGNLGSTMHGKFQPDGEITDWGMTSTGPNLGSAYGVALAAYNGYLYASGNYPNSAGDPAKNVTYYNKINSDGTLNNWIQGTNMNTARATHRMVAIGGYLYVQGGCSTSGVLGACTGETGSAEYAQINADGSIGSWVNTTGSTTRMWAASAFDGKRFYFLGGCNDGQISVGQCNNTPLTTVNYFTIESAGVVKSYAGTTGLPNNRSGLTSVAYNGYLYAIGGESTLGIKQGDVLYASINGNGSIGAWTSTTGYPSARSGHTSVIVNGYLYIIGGSTGTGVFRDDVQYAQINTNGTVGSWSATTSFTGARFNHASVVRGEYIYITGGVAGATHYSDVQYAKVNANGTLGAWSSTTDLGGERYYHAAVQYDGYLYVIGGNNGSSTTSSVIYAPINTNGTVGAWSSTSSILVARENHKALVYKGYIYVTGGQNGANTYSSSQSARVNSDGTLDSWSYTLSFSTARYSHAMTNDGSYVYLLGGYDGGYLNSVEYTTISNGGYGTNTSWGSAGPDGGVRQYHQVVAYNGYIYLIGGCINSTCGTTGDQTGGIQYAAINASGGVGSWNNTNGVSARQGHVAIARNGYIYVIGGEYRTGIFNTLTQRDDAWYATIDPNTGALGVFVSTTGTTGTTNGAIATAGDALYVTSTVSGYLRRAAISSSTGSITAWTIPSIQLNVNRYNPGMVYAKGYLYVVGGCNVGQACNASNTLNSVERAPVSTAPGGSITGDWEIVSHLPVKRALTGGKVFYLNGYLIIPPNFTPGSTGQEVYHAPLTANGYIGQWQKGNDLGATRTLAASAEHGGKLYLQGGITGTNTIAGTFYSTTITSVSRVGSFSRVYELASGAHPAKLITRGTKALDATVKLDYFWASPGSSTYSDSSSTINTGFGASSADTFTLTSGTNKTLTPYLMLRYTIDERYSSVFPDAGNSTQIADFDLYFIAGPSGRLKGGRMFTEGADRGLEAGF